MDFRVIHWIKLIYWFLTFPLGPSERRRKITRLLSKSKYFDSRLFFDPKSFGSSSSVSSPRSSTQPFPHSGPQNFSFGEMASPTITPVFVPIRNSAFSIKHHLLAAKLTNSAEHVRYIFLSLLFEELHHVKKTSEEAFSLYGLPFEVVHFNKPITFAEAVNHAVSTFKFRRFFLLGENTFPTDSSSFSKILNTLTTSPPTTILSGVRVGELESPQSFELELFENPPRSKRFLVSLPYLSEPLKDFNRIQSTLGRPLSPNCIATTSELFSKVGGFNSCYSNPDYVLSDFSLRALKEGSSLSTHTLSHFNSFEPSFNERDFQEKEVELFSKTWLHTLRQTKSSSNEADYEEVTCASLS